MSGTILSIDCGTQSARVILFSKTGDVLALEKIVYKPYESLKPGWAEQDPEVYWKSIKKGCKQLRKKHPEAFGSVKGIGITTIRNSMVCVDKEGKPMRPAILWLDQRKAEPVYSPWLGMRLLIGIIGMTRAIDKAQRDGKCNWIRQNQPEIWKQTAKYLQLSGFLNYRFTGKFSDSVGSQIGHIPFDYKRQKWGNLKHLLVFSAKIYPVEKSKLPDLVQPGDLIGHVTREAAEETGLAVGLPVIACASDKGCGTLGVGVESEDSASLSFGTTASIQTTSKKYREPITFMPSYPAAIPKAFNPEVEIFRGFWMISWFKEQFAQLEIKEAEKLGIETEELLNSFLNETNAGAMGLVTQPLWTPGLLQPDARGTILGFGDVHDRKHVYRSIIEGICFGLREGMERIEKVSNRAVKELKVSGGASKSDAICQIASDILNLKVTRGATTESSALGAAVIVAKALGYYSSYSEAIKGMVHNGKVFKPDEKNVPVYNRIFKEVYKKIYVKAEPLYKALRKITGYPE